MNKKIYLTPALRMIDLVEEGMIAGSISMDANQNLGEDGEFTQKQQDPDLWGNESVWK